MFVWHARTLLRALHRYRPDIAAAAESVEPPRAGAAWRVPAEVMRAIPAEAIDRAVLEKSPRVCGLRAGFHWSDLGNWSAIGSLLASAPGGNRARGRLLAIDAAGCMAITDEGLIALAGVRDLIVVRSGDVVLVCPREAAQRVRDLVRHLRGPLRRFS
jgi:mannose-1-phosphate guanylyltransferase